MSIFGNDSIEILKVIVDFLDFQHFIFIIALLR